MVVWKNGRTEGWKYRPRWNGPNRLPYESDAESNVDNDAESGLEINTKIVMRTKPAVCFLPLGCELRYNTADTAGLG